MNLPHVKQCQYCLFMGKSFGLWLMAFWPGMYWKPTYQFGSGQAGVRLPLKWRKEKAVFPIAYQQG